MTIASGTVEATAQAVAPPSPWYSVHISKSVPYRLQAFDRLLTLKQTGGCATPSRHKRGLRGSVNGLSKPARNRLLKLLGMVGRIDGCAFVTLTSRANQTSWGESKDDLDHFFTRLRQLFSDVCGVWRFAWQSRGSAHYHLLLWGLGEGSDGHGPSEEILSRVWLKIIGESGDKYSEQRAVDSRYVHDFRACGFYLALYQADQRVSEHDSKQSGRTWGILQRSRLQLQPKFVGDFTDYQAQYCRRVLRNIRRRRQFARTGQRQRKGMGPLARRSGSFSAFLPVEETTRLVSYVKRFVDAKNRVVGIESVIQPIGENPF